MFVVEFGTEYTKVLHLLNLTTQSNTENIGTIDIYGVFMPSGCGSSLIGLFSGIIKTDSASAISSVSFSNLGESTNFGDLIYAKYYIVASCSSSTRFLNIGGQANNVELDTISYSNIATSGSMNDFGNLSEPKICSSTSSKTRSVIETIVSSSGSNTLIEYVEMATTGNSSNFGNMTNSSGWGCNSATSNCHGGLS